MIEDTDCPVSLISDCALLKLTQLTMQQTDLGKLIKGPTDIVGTILLPQHIEESWFGQRAQTLCHDQGRM